MTRVTGLPQRGDTIKNSGHGVLPVTTSRGRLHLNGSRSEPEQTVLNRIEVCGAQQRPLRLPLALDSFHEGIETCP